MRMRCGGCGVAEYVDEAILSRVERPSQRKSEVERAGRRRAAVVALDLLSHKV